jgi:hypothetical protein
MANALGMNLGEVYRTVEAVKGSRQSRDIQNKLMRWKTSDRELASARVNKLAGLKQDVATGQEGAMKALTLFDADEAKAITDVLASADDRKIDQMKRNTDMLGRILGGIRNAQDPAGQYERSRNYLAGVNPELVKDMPEEYSPDFVEFGIGRAMQMDDFLKSPEAVQFGGEDILYRGGQEIERTESGASRKARLSGGGRGPKTGDYSLANKAVWQIMTGLDITNPDQQKQIGAKFSQPLRRSYGNMASRAAWLMEKRGMNPLEAADSAINEAVEAGEISRKEADAAKAKSGATTDRNALRVFNPSTGKFD